jgi:MFS family permease
VASRPNVSTAARSDVRKLAVGRFLSFTGSIAAGTALNFTLFDQTGSAWWVALSLFLTWGVRGFFSPVAGAIGDRFDRRIVMIVSELGGAVAWVLASFFVGSPAVLLGFAFASSVIESPFQPAVGAAIPNVAGEENLSWANSLIGVGRYAGLAVGPLVGGVLVATAGSRWVFLANALSFVVSAVLVASIHVSFSARDEANEAEERHRTLMVGFRFIRRDRVLRQLLLSYFVFIIGMAGTLIADPVLADEFHVGSVGYGALTACWGAGTIVGAWLGRHVREEREGWWMFGFSGLVALTGFAVALSPWFWLVLVWIVGFGLADGPTQVVEQNLLQRRTPDHVRSRVMGAWESIMHVALVVSFLLGGLIVPIVGGRGAYAFGGITGVIGTLLLLPLVRWLPDRDEAFERDAIDATAPLRSTE